MDDFIIRTPYLFNDERLFVFGWRSFSNLILSKNILELVKEYESIQIIGDTVSEYVGINTFVEEDPNFEYICINDMKGIINDFICKNDFLIESIVISVNNINEPKTDEIFGVNDLSSLIKDVLSINSFEISSEIFLLNSINEPKSNEIYGVNDLSGSICLVSSINAFEISSEIFGINSLNSIYTQEISLINYLSLEKISEKICKNDIFENEIADCEIFGINRFDDSVSFTSYSPVIYIYIDNLLVSEFVEAWNITINEDSYVNSVDVSFVNRSLFSKCNPLTNIAQRRIKIIIDDIEFNFLLEKRNISRTPMSENFSIWGRSYIATLDLPYAIPINDKEIVFNSETGEWYSPGYPLYVPHIWQTGDVLASEVIGYLVNGTLGVDFRINDFIIKKGVLSVSNESPISIINRIVSSVGAYIRTDLLDRIVIKYWEFDTLGEPVATFSDLEDIFLMDEEIKYPEGYNRVLVRGYSDSLIETSSSLKLELDEDRNEKRTSFNFGEKIWIKLYLSPFNVDYTISCSLGSINIVSLEVSEEITEEKSEISTTTLNVNYPISSVSLIEKYDCTNIPNSNYSFIEGYGVITLLEEFETEPVLVSYFSKYNLYELVVNKPCDVIPWEEILSTITVKKI